MRDITIRPYTPADYASLCAIHDPARKVELALAGLDEAFLPFSIAAEREDFFDCPHIDVAEIDGAAAGFSAFSVREIIEGVMPGNEAYRVKVYGMGRGQQE